GRGGWPQRAPAVVASVLHLHLAGGQGQQHLRGRRRFAGVGVRQEHRRRHVEELLAQVSLAYRAGGAGQLLGGQRHGRLCALVAGRGRRARRTRTAVQEGDPRAAAGGGRHRLRRGREGPHRRLSPVLALIAGTKSPSCCPSLRWSVARMSENRPCSTCSRAAATPWWPICPGLPATATTALATAASGRSWWSTPAACPGWKRPWTCSPRSRCASRSRKRRCWSSWSMRATDCCRRTT